MSKGTDATTAATSCGMKAGWSLCDSGDGRSIRDQAGKKRGKENRMNCQLVNTQELVKRNTPWEDLAQMRIKILWDTKKKLLLLKNRSMKALGMKQSGKVLAKSELPSLQPGDLVRVKSAEEIRSVLDENGGSQGCVFTPEMYRHCGKEARVFKRVDYFYDEVKSKMCRCRNLVLLEDAFCSGKRRAFPEACDRNCFLFWHSSWLMKLEGKDSG